MQDLEQRGVHCWIAPRDIPQAAIWPVEIQKAISLGSIFLLVLSPGANESAEIIKEVNEAARHRKPLYVARTQDIQRLMGLDIILVLFNLGIYFVTEARLFKLVVQDIEVRAA